MPGGGKDGGPVRGPLPFLPFFFLPLPPLLLVEPLAVAAGVVNCRITQAWL